MHTNVQRYKWIVIAWILILNQTLNSPAEMALIIIIISYKIWILLVRPGSKIWSSILPLVFQDFYFITNDIFKPVWAFDNFSFSVNVEVKYFLNFVFEY